MITISQRQRQERGGQGLGPQARGALRLARHAPARQAAQLRQAGGKTRASLFFFKKSKTGHENEAPTA